MTTPTLVLVHGAFADASSWWIVYDELSRDGLTAVAPPVPLRGVTSDAAYLSRVLDQIDGPAILVGHSNGGAVITLGGAASAFDEPAPVAAWKTTPSFGLVPTADMAINPDVHRLGYERARMATLEVEGASHAVALSQPRAVAGVIRNAVASVVAVPA